MKPAMKYSALTLLYETHPEPIWEQDIFAVLDRCYRRSETAPLREELVGLRTLGWIEPSEETEFDGQILRRYVLIDRYVDVVARQINVSAVSAFLRPHQPQTSVGPVRT